MNRLKALLVGADFMGSYFEKEEMYESYCCLS
jgi:hypothetical protein